MIARRVDGVEPNVRVQSADKLWNVPLMNMTRGTPVPLTGRLVLPVVVAKKFGLPEVALTDDVQIALSSTPHENRLGGGGGA